MLLCSKCERGCLCVFPVVPFSWGSSHLAEPAHFLNSARFTWPCPRPQLSLFYPLNMTPAGSQSSAAANHNMAPPL